MVKASGQISTVEVLFEVHSRNDRINPEPVFRQAHGFTLSELNA